MRDCKMAEFPVKETFVIDYDLHYKVDSKENLIFLVENINKEYLTSIMNLRETAIRNALISLGWTPPPEVEKVNENEGV